MQQLFRLLIFLIQPHMFRATNSPILRSTFWLYIQLLVQCTDTAGDRCHGWDGTAGRQQCRCIVPKAVYTVKKRSWGWANLPPETCRGWIKKINKWKSYCIFLVIYIVFIHEFSLQNYSTMIKSISAILTRFQRCPSVEYMYFACSFLCVLQTGF